MLVLLRTELEQEKTKVGVKGGERIYRRIEGGFIYLCRNKDVSASADKALQQSRFDSLLFQNGSSAFN